ncbi:hypothetical protein SAMN02745704_00518 [Paucidesulfovibrio gracilis DSM 16080]|uniref:Uncharacterized protein n=1 Tax=Paucidesulfovibrio gracilis DSM 16080 TaxID=1121449 RepID=A0A1T4W8V4_9BACT|nr:hypothetical protein SAMN02745704_00518 [Paucidesulfovibrio gracilis DSM 16080]
MRVKGEQPLESLGRGPARNSVNVGTPRPGGVVPQSGTKIEPLCQAAARRSAGSLHGTEQAPPSRGEVLSGRDCVFSASRVLTSVRHCFSGRLRPARTCSWDQMSRPAKACPLSPPPAMRESSRRTPSASRRRHRVKVCPSCTSLAMRKCRLARAASWGQWVMSSTC